MARKTKRWWAAPIFAGDEDKTRVAGLLNTILLILSIASVVLIVGALIGGNTRPLSFGLIGLFGITMLMLQIPLRRGQVQLASNLLIGILSFATIGTVAVGGTIRAPGLIYLILSIMMAGLLLGRKATLLTALGNCVLVLGLMTAEINNVLPPPILTVTISQGVAFAAGALMTVVLLNMTTENLDQALSHARRELVERSRTETKLQHRAEEMYLLYKMGIALTSGQNLYQALRAFVKELRQVMIADAFYVVIYDEETDTIEYPLYLNLDDDLHVPSRKLSINPGLTGEVIATRKTLYLPDISIPEVQAAHKIVVIVDMGVTSYIGIPLIIEEKVIGVLSVQARAANAYSTEQVQLLETFAAQVAITVEKSRLFAQLQQELAERQRAEEEVRQLNVELEERVERRTAELMAVNKELEAFSYSVSHDLRAPLRGIDGFSRILIEDYAGQLDREAQGYLERVSDSAQRMGQLIDDLLDFSRLSRQPLHKQLVRPADLAQQVLNELQPVNANRPVEIVLGDLPTCAADPSLLRQVFLNLIDNALKYSSKRSQPNIEIGHQVLPPETIYFVRDNGAGFDMQYADKLFGVFQRLHRADEFEGTGVGLAIVQRIVQRHGGRIWAEAQPEQGATFYFTLGSE